MSQPMTRPASPATSGGGGGADEELPGIPERPVDLDVEDPEGVVPEAPEPDDARSWRCG